MRQFLRRQAARWQAKSLDGPTDSAAAASIAAPVKSSLAIPGVVLGLLAYWLFSFQDAAVKWLVADLPVWQILFVRSATILVLCLGIGRMTTLRALWRSPAKTSLLVRGVVLLVAWLLYFTAARDLPLAEVTTIYFSAPVIVMVLAAIILGERLRLAKVLAVSIGLVGVAIASGLNSFDVTPAFWLVFAAAACWGLGIVLMRKIAQRESALVQAMACNLLFLVVTGIPCLIFWSRVSPFELVLMVAAGVVSGIAQLCLYRAADTTQASTLATLEYSGLIWATLLGFIIWHDVPGLRLWIGMGMVVMAGLLILRAGRRRASSA